MSLTTDEPARTSISMLPTRPGIVLAIWTDAAQHSTVVQTAQMLSERGYDVEIVSRSPSVEERYGGDVDFGQRTRVHPVARGASWAVHGMGLSARASKLGYIQFIVALRRLIRDRRPVAIIGYDIHGLLAVTCASSGMGIPFIYHNFDLYVPGDSRWSNLLPLLERQAARRAAATIFSTPDRAAIFRAWARLKQDPFVVFNSPRLTKTGVPTGETARLLRRGGFTAERTVLHLGSIYPHHGVEAAIRSVPSWPADSGLILAGSISAPYQTLLEDLIRSVRVDGRVRILPHVSRLLWYDALLSADLGLALYEPVNLNQRFMAGAANKLNLYMKAGIPSVVWNAADIELMVGRLGFGVAADPTDSDSIAVAVNSLLGDQQAYSRCRDSARSAFITEINFETQIDPVMDFIQGLGTVKALGGRDA